METRIYYDIKTKKYFVKNKEIICNKCNKTFNANDFILICEKYDNYLKNEIIFLCQHCIYKLKFTHRQEHRKVGIVVKTVPNDFINYPTCALISVQPTWNSPYIHHLPSSVNLQLTFQDMSPLYRETIEKGSIINIISPTESRARQESNVIQRKKAQSQAQQNMPSVIRSDGRH